MTRKLLNLIAGAAFILSFAGTTATGQVIISDNYNAVNVNNGFALGEGVNSEINPPATRLTGLAAAGLRYINVGDKPDNVYYLAGDARLRVNNGAQNGRITISDGSGPFDFGPALSTIAATPADPVVYDITIKMDNNSTGNARFSFALGTVEGNTGVWDFGLQLYRVGTDTFYTVQKRLDTASTGLAADVNAVMFSLPSVPTGSEVSFVIRVTDAGAESGTDYNSRVQVFANGSATPDYDTDTDTALVNGFRFDGLSRYFSWDIAGNNGSFVTYDDFSVTYVSGPPPYSLPPTYVWDGGGADDFWGTDANWVDNISPTAGLRQLVFNGGTRPVNANNIAGLVNYSLSFNNGGFQLFGPEPIVMFKSISNVAGLNTIVGDLTWTNDSGKSWNIAQGSELSVENTTTIPVGGDHVFSGGGRLRVKGQMTIEPATPLFNIRDGELMMDGGTFSSAGGVRVGIDGTVDPGSAQVVVTNNGTLRFTRSLARLRLGDVANANGSLLLNNGTVEMAGGYIAVPYAAGGTAVVSQVGGTVTKAVISFSENGAGNGSYTIKNGTLEAYQIRENTAGTSAIYFDNALLRALQDSTNAFMTGLDSAEILAGGLTIDAFANVTIGQALSGAGSITNDNSGSGVVTLTGNNSYTGNTYVKSGKLVLRTGRSFGSALLVNDYATLGILVNSQDNFVTNASLALGYGSTVSFELGTLSNPETNAMLKVASLSATGPVTLELTKSTLLGLSEGVIPLVDYEGTVGGGIGNFLANTPVLPNGVSGYLEHNAAETRIDLVITGVPGLLWTGAVDNIWDGSRQNWIDMQTGNPTTFVDGYPTYFRDGASTGNIQLDGSIIPNPSVIVISNSALPYVFTGGAIGSGSGPLIKKYGSSSFTRSGGFAANGDFVNGVELNDGSFIVGGAADETLAVKLTDVSGGTGTLVKTGTGTLFLNSTNASYQGAVRIEQGLVKVGHTDSLGDKTATTGVVTILPGATLDVNDHQFGARRIVVSGNGSTGQGAIIDSVNSGAAESNFSDVTLAGDTSFGALSNARWDVRSGSATAPGLVGGGYNLNKVGPGTVSIASTGTNFWNMNLGDVVVKEGGLTFAESLNPNNPEKVIAVWPGARFALFNLGLTNPITRNIYATNATLNANGQPTGYTNVYTGNVQMSGSVLFSFEGPTKVLFNGPLTGASDFNVSGVDGSVLHLNAANTYTGPTIVTNVTLAGAGSINGNLTIQSAATLAPGNPVGTFTVQGNANIEGTAVMELNGTANYDRLVAGSITFPGKLTVVVLTAQPGVYQLFNHPVSIAPANLTLPALPSGMNWVNKLDQDGSIEIAGQTTPPNISDVSLIGGTFTFSGTGGTEGAGYTVVTSTDLMIPLQSWTPVATGTFGAGGSFSFSTNNIGSNPQQFFGIRTP